uniref:Uncharacterized protein n=1 Tax=Rhizophagus irregularis (strain DAOM 181602 / DAOM 197198 / MUCL 43194) TaxID=747089 RepID=U9TKP8_RHIID
MDSDIPCKKKYKMSGSTKNYIEYLANKYQFYQNEQIKTWGTINKLIHELDSAFSMSDYVAYNILLEL